MGVLPLALVAGGVWAPALVALPVTLLPIAGKTVRRLVYEEAALGAIAGWLSYAALPLALAGLLAWWALTKARAGAQARLVLPATLVTATWIVFALNLAIFRYPWPWAAWTTRTPHAVVFGVCACGLTLLAWRAARGTTA